MKRYCVIALGATVAACGGGGVDGNYVGVDRPDRSITIAGDNATVAEGTQSMKGTARKADKSVFVTVDKETKELKVDDKGCLVNAEVGTFCKK